VALRPELRLPARAIAHVPDSGSRSEEDNHADRETGPVVAPIRVLVAEALPPTRAGVRLALERDGCLVAEAATVAAVLEAASRERPDICLLDTELPDDVIEALTVINAAVPGSAIVMFARSPNGTELLKCVEAGASGYLPKEIEPSKLSLALRRAVEGEAAVPRALVTALIDELGEQARRRRLPLVRDLTSREFDVLDLMSRGLTTGEIAEQLHVAKVTVRTHVASILRKLGAADRDAAIRVLERC
jgi:DNA-binding NarL/FixJ family response regulator